MILTCPSCATRYLVDPAALGETGRMVRCARCAHTWVEFPPDDMPKRVDVREVLACDSRKFDVEVCATLHAVALLQQQFGDTGADDAIA